MKVNLDFLNFLGGLYQIPWKTPNRFKMILDYAQEGYQHFANGYEIDVPFFNDGNGNFLLTMNCILKFAEYAKSFRVSEDNHIIIDVVLLPSMYFCCGKSIKMDPRYASLILYCETEIKMAKSYRGKCSKCHEIYYYSFQSNPKDNYCKFIDEDRDYIVFSSRVGFSKTFLHNTDMQTSIGVVSFESCAEIYNNTVNVKAALLYPDRLEEGWFV